MATCVGWSDIELQQEELWFEAGLPLRDVAQKSSVFSFTFVSKWVPQYQDLKKCWGVTLKSFIVASH